MFYFYFSAACQTVEKSLEELQCKIRSATSILDTLMSEIMTQLNQPNDISSIKIGLTLLSNSINEGRPLEIDSQIDKVLLALAKLLSGKICDMIQADEEGEKAIDLLQRSLNTVAKILKVKKYAKVIKASSIQQLIHGALRRGLKIYRNRVKKIREKLFVQIFLHKILG